MSAMLSKVVEQSTTRHTNYWFPILIWIAVLVASLVAVTASIANVVIGETRKVDLPPQVTAKGDDVRASYRRPRTIPFPADNPYTFEKVVLGKKLYFDTRLSQANLLSCASCHSPSYGWSDGQPTGVGHLMKRLGRRSPTIINAAYGLIFMWDGRADTLEEQALGPIQADVEMAMPLDQLLKRLRAIPEYPPLFEAAFPGQGITAENIGKAIATYERTVISGRAPFDAWIDGDERAISDAAKRGFTLFNTKAAVQRVPQRLEFHRRQLPRHRTGERGHRTRKNPAGGSQVAARVQDAGLARDHAPRAVHAQRVDERLSSRWSSTTTPAAINRPSRSELIKPLNLTDQEKADLVAFLKTLTSNLSPTAMPVLPR